MKPILALLLLVTTTAMHAQDASANFKGEIKNNKADSLIVQSMRGKFRKALALDKTGHFQGLIQQGVGMFIIRVGQQETPVFLSNDINLTITADAADLYGTITFSGDGAKENQILRQVQQEAEAFSESAEKQNNPEALKARAAQLSESWDALLKEANLSFASQTVVRTMCSQQKFLINSTVESAEDKLTFTGKPAPQFSYKDVKGKTVSLSDFKGKYVYIDVWATWCKPCMMEIPDLLALQKTLKDKNIAFISVSIDKPEDAEKWKKVVAEKHLGGTQLIAENAWDSSMVRDYKIESVPRFILIDPQGKIVDFDAKRPSNEELVKELNALLR